MPRTFTDLANFTAAQAWGARDIAEIEGASVRVHWTDQPYVWHVNDGAEVFLVLAGTVEMRFRSAGVEQAVVLSAGDLFVADRGDEHVAHPRGEARILVVERKGSI